MIEIEYNYEREREASFSDNEEEIKLIIGPHTEKTEKKI